jgi:hypothetical protein
MSRRHCPYAKSDTTPCVLRDGEICFAFDVNDEPICVGCEHTPKTLGVPRPKDWNKMVERYHKQGRRR